MSSAFFNTVSFPTTFQIQHRLRHLEKLYVKFQTRFHRGSGIVDPETQLPPFIQMHFQRVLAAIPELKTEHLCRPFHLRNHLNLGTVRSLLIQCFVHIERMDNCEPLLVFTDDLIIILYAHKILHHLPRNVRIFRIRPFHFIHKCTQKTFRPLSPISDHFA